jgi:hypothetical protein
MEWLVELGTRTPDFKNSITFFVQIEAVLSHYWLREQTGLRSDRLPNAELREQREEKTMNIETRESLRPACLRTKFRYVPL